MKTAHLAHVVPACVLPGFVLAHLVREQTGAPTPGRGTKRSSVRGDGSTTLQGATLELLVELFVLQSAEARDLEAARENAAEPGKLPSAVEAFRRFGDSDALVLARRLTDEGVALEVEGGRARDNEVVHDRLDVVRREGLCPEPPVFTR